MFHHTPHHNQVPPHKQAEPYVQADQTDTGAELFKVLRTSDGGIVLDGASLTSVVSVEDGWPSDADVGSTTVLMRTPVGVVAVPLAKYGVMQ